MNAPLRYPPQSLIAEGFAMARQEAVDRYVASVPHRLIPWHSDVWHGFSDGSATPSPGRIGIGGYLVSPDGRITGAFAETCGYGSSYTAEFLAAMRLLDQAREAGIRRILLHTDNRGLAHVCELGLLRRQKRQFNDDVRRHCRGIHDIHFSWLPREENKLADWLSRAALLHPGESWCQPVELAGSRDTVDSLRAAGCAQPSVPHMSVFKDAWLAFPMTPQCMGEIGARRVLRLPCPIEVAPAGLAPELHTFLLLERAATSRERSKARFQSRRSGVPYFVMLKRILSSAAVGMPFDAFLEARIARRETSKLAAASQRRRPEATGHDAPGGPPVSLAHPASAPV